MNKKKQVLKNSSILKEKPTNEQNDSLLEKQSYELTDQESLHISEQQSDQSQDVPIDGNFSTFFIDSNLNSLFLY